MALGSWQGLYNAVIDQLMDERRDQELLLLMAIVRYADRLGFCFPGRARLMAKRHISQPIYEARLAFLEKRCLVRVEESYDYRRRQAQFDFQISPRVLYVREEFQDYCERIFDQVEGRNFRLEKWLLENHFSTNDSQPESEPDVVPESEPDVVPDSDPDAVTQTQEPAKYNQRGKTRAPKQEGRTTTTMRSEDQPTADQTANGSQTRSAQKNYPQAGSSDEFAALLSPDVDDDRIAQEIKHAAATTLHQAKKAVATYPRDAIVYWLEHTAIRRAKGELGNPGAYFFSVLKRQTPIEIDKLPDWAQEQIRSKNQSDNQNSDSEEF